MTEPIRRATADDAPACAAILNAWIDGTDWMPRTMSPDAIETGLRQGLPKREAYVVGDPVAGYLSLDPAENHIWGLYVGRSGQGLGKALLDRAKTGRSYLKLNSHAANEAAHRFYAREAFQPIGAPWQGSDGIPEVTFEWRT
ncbi:GNAT family N-acetyltransferase [Litoreibacter roseus]|uniref:N-acetyltransferase GCN5 n=1 Tax=Litoreibacter roseus TaxID=2601869 RepID=A0A6N6JDA7_9RHOB|nr:GNAT family N-acetyltransferase [Litoreibacter roseus]GFE63967.1 N-acetyltransferase GCN5 [Litoreibacter roseus]